VIESLKVFPGIEAAQTASNCDYKVAELQAQRKKILHHCTEVRTLYNIRKKSDFCFEKKKTNKKKSTENSYRHLTEKKKSFSVPSSKSVFLKQNS